MSNYLRERCEVGETLMMEAPLGSFYLREVERPLVLSLVEPDFQPFGYARQYRRTA